MPVPEYRYEFRRGEEVLATGRLSPEEALEMGERIIDQKRQTTLDRRLVSAYRRELTRSAHRLRRRLEPPRLSTVGGVFPSFLS